MRSLHSSIWLSGILVVAFSLRLLYLSELRHTPFFDHLVLDLAAYDAWGQRIAQGDWLGSQVFYQDPLYPYFLGVLYRVFGRHLPTVYLIQIALDVLTCYLIYWIGRKLFSIEVGLLAGLLAASYKPFIFYAVQVEKSFMAVLLLAASCVLLLQARDRRLPRDWILAGLMQALAILIRGNFLLLVPILVIGILLMSPGGGPRRMRSGVLYTLGVLLILMVTLIRNYRVGGDLVLTTSQAGQNFFIGNNPENLTGMYRVPDFVRADPKFEQVDFAREAERLTGQALKPSQVSNFWLRRATEFIVDRPLDFLRLAGLKARLFWNHYEIPDNLDGYFFERYSFVLRLWLPTFGVVAPLGILGMGLALGAWRRLWPLYLFALGYFLSVILFYVFSRYRLPIVPFLMVFAAHALHELYSCVRQRRVKKLIFSAVAFSALACGVNISLLDAYNPSAVNNLGAVLLQMGDFENAEVLFRDVLTKRPAFADARNNLGVALLRRGRVEDALDQIHEAIRLRPRLPNSYVNLGQALLRKGDQAGAKNAFLEALEIDPATAEAHAGLGLIHRTDGNDSAALEAFGRALALDPQSAEVRNNLGIVLLGRGQLHEALEHLDAAIRENVNLAEAHFNRGICLERLNRKSEAIASYRAAVAARIDYAEAYNNLGNLLAESGDRNGALEAYKNFLRYWKGDRHMREAVLHEVDKFK